MLGLPTSNNGLDRRMAWRVVAMSFALTAGLGWILVVMLGLPTKIHSTPSLYHRSDVQASKVTMLRNVTGTSSNSTFQMSDVESIGQTLVQDGAFTGKNTTGARRPSIALLMSFPNSGTTYTLTNTRGASQRRTATNYCEGCAGVIPNFDGRPSSYPQLYPSNNGTVSREGKKVSIVSPHVACEAPTAKHLQLPSDFILTKTHCGGRCNHCAPHKYMISSEQFDIECRQVCTTAGTEAKTVEMARPKHGEPAASKTTVKHEDRPAYDPGMIGKVVHLIRSPFDNIVSRFHYHSRNDKDEEHRQEYPLNATGFRDYCQDFQGKTNSHSKEEKEWYGKTLLGLAKQVPCHAELFRYVQWHNYALDFIERNNFQNGSDESYSSMRSLTIHYEDYLVDHDQSQLKGSHGREETNTERILEFLHLPKEGEKTLFHMSDYSDYFTQQDRVAARLFAKTLATPETWNLISHYFP
jgi:hypothetical protein